jgi:hypothetical protein
MNLIHRGIRTGIAASVVAVVMTAFAAAPASADDGNAAVTEPAITIPVPDPDPTVVIPTIELGTEGIGILYLSMPVAQDPCGTENDGWYLEYVTPNVIYSETDPETAYATGNTIAEGFNALRGGVHASPAPGYYFPGGTDNIRNSAFTDVPCAPALEPVSITVTYQCTARAEKWYDRQGLFTATIDPGSNAVTGWEWHLDGGNYYTGGNATGTDTIHVYTNAPQPGDYPWTADIMTGPNKGGSEHGTVHVGDACIDSPPQDGPAEPQPMDPSSVSAQYDCNEGFPQVTFTLKSTKYVDNWLVSIDDVHIRFSEGVEALTVEFKAALTPGTYKFQALVTFQGLDNRGRVRSTFTVSDDCGVPATTTPETTPIPQVDSGTPPVPPTTEPDWTVLYPATPIPATPVVVEIGEPAVASPAAATVSDPDMTMVLPATGLNSSQLAVIAAMLLGFGFICVTASRRRQTA